MQCILVNAHWTLYNVHYCVYSYCTLYIVHYTLCTHICTLYSVNCTQIGSYYVIVTDCFNMCDYSQVKGEETFTLCAIHLYWWLCFDRKQFQNEAKFDYVYISPCV